MNGFQLKKILLILVILVKIFIFILCVLFLFSDAKMIYLSFNGNDIKGFIIGIINLTVVHLSFLLLFYAALNKIVKSSYIIILGSFLSCNAGFYAVIRQSIFDDRTVSAQPYLYLIPLICLPFIFFIRSKNKKQILDKTYIRNLLLHHPFFDIALIYLLILPFIPRNNYFMSFINLNHVILFALSAAQLILSKKVRKTSGF